MDTANSSGPAGRKQSWLEERGGEVDDIPVPANTPRISMDTRGVHPNVSWERQLFGDRWARGVLMPPIFTTAEKDRIVASFP
jgi:hypothetical protein